MPAIVWAMHICFNKYNSRSTIMSIGDSLYMSTSVHFCCTIKSVKWSANKQEREYRTCNNRNHAIYYVYRYIYINIYKYKIYIHIQSHIQWTLRWKANGTYYYLCSLAVLICVLLLLFLRPSYKALAALCCYARSVDTLFSFTSRTGKNKMKHTPKKRTLARTHKHTTNDTHLNWTK